jgi:hypothetical protein
MLVLLVLRRFARSLFDSWSVVAASTLCVPCSSTKRTAENLSVDLLVKVAHFGINGSDAGLMGGIPARGRIFPWPTSVESRSDCLSCSIESVRIR